MRLDERPNLLLPENLRGSNERATHVAQPTQLVVHTRASQRLQLVCRPVLERVVLARQHAQVGCPRGALVAKRELTHQVEGRAKHRRNCARRYGHPTALGVFVLACADDSIAWKTEQQLTTTNRPNSEDAALTLNR